jgi:mRNA interferase MazF
MERGTIVLTPFPFTDLPSAKRRPALIVSPVEDPASDVLVAFISSVVPPSPKPTDLILREGDIGFRQTGLSRDSVFKMSKLATISPSIFTGEIGEVPDEMMVEIEKRLLIALDLLKWVQPRKNV